MLGDGLFRGAQRNERSAKAARSFLCVSSRPIASADRPGLRSNYLINSPSSRITHRTLGDYFRAGAPGLPEVSVHKMSAAWHLNTSPCSADTHPAIEVGGLFGTVTV